MKIGIIGAGKIGRDYAAELKGKVLLDTCNPFPGREGLAIAVRLVEDAGFEPVVFGTLASAKEFDAGTDVFGRALTARELRQALGIAN
jgi:predicted dinucleotide-binding enzyme